MTQLSQDRAHPVRLVGPAHHHRTKRSREKPYDPRDADLGDYRPAAQQNNAANPRRMPLREAEDPHVAYRGADNVRSVEFECVQSAPQNVGDERAVRIPGEVDRRTGSPPRAVENDRAKVGKLGDQRGPRTRAGRAVDEKDRLT